MTIRTLIEYTVHTDLNEHALFVWFDLYKGEVSVCLTKDLYEYSHKSKSVYEIEVYNGLKTIRTKTL